MKAVERYVLGDLSVSEVEEFERHFFDCPQCSEELRTLSVLQDNARAVFLEPSPRPIPASLPAAESGGRLVANCGWCGRRWRCLPWEFSRVTKPVCIAEAARSNLFPRFRCMRRHAANRLPLRRQRERRITRSTWIGPGTAISRAIAPRSATTPERNTPCVWMRPCRVERFMS